MRPLKKRLMSIIRCPYFAICAFLAWAQAAAPHNGAVALAYPVTGIAVDGDLSDWPQDLPRYPIVRCELGDEPRDTKDFKAAFRIGYNARENALYIGVEAEDEAITIAPGDNWMEQDGCDVYINPAHRDSNSTAYQFALWGKHRKAYNNGTHASGLTAFDLVAQRYDGRHIYEWRLDLNKMGPEGTAVGPGAVMALDISVADKDADSSFSWMAWGQGTVKMHMHDRRGDVALLESPPQTGRVQGRIHWQGTNIRRGKATLHQAEQPGQWIGLVPMPKDAFLSKCQLVAIRPEPWATAKWRHPWRCRWNLGGLDHWN